MKHFGVSSVISHNLYSNFNVFLVLNISKYTIILLIVIESSIGTYYLFDIGIFFKTEAPTLLRCVNFYW